MVRIYFESNKIRDKFFEDVKKYGGFNTWNDLSNFLGKKRSVLGYYRAGEYSLPKDLFDRLFKVLPCQLQVFFKEHTKRISSNWGQRKGGNATCCKHPEIFEVGRKVLRKKRKVAEENAFDLNLRLSSRLCEFLGAFIGDGFTNVYNARHYQTGFAGHRNLDRAYYDSIIIPTAVKLFGVKACIREKENALWVTFNSKRLFQLLTERFKMPAGLKFDKVLIPEEILSANSPFVSDCLRGIFDTDGCVYFDKRSIYREPYIRVELNMHNEKIIGQIFHCLNGLGINVKRLEGKHRLQVIGKNSVKQFLEKVGFSNNKHRNRIAKFFPELEKITNKLQTG